MPTSQPIQVLHQAMSIDQVLSPHIYVFYASFLLAFIFTPIMRSVAIYYNIVDKPDMVRKLHSAPVAYLGGVAVFIGWLAGVAVTQFQTMHVVEPGLSDRLQVPLAVVTAAFIIVILGLWDDLKHISPRIKIGGQLLAGITLLSQGIGTQITGFFIRNIVARLEARTDLLVPPGLLEGSILVTSILLTLALIVFCCNAANLMDGLDGLCSGVTAIIAAGFVFLAVVIARQENSFYTFSEYADRINMDALRMIVAIALLGAVLGFVPYNF
ncbi:MAG TPA: MraY family glycosyltransferase, partial [Tepidisphaeraceae bacterium]